MHNAWKAQLCSLQEKNNKETQIPDNVLNAVILLVWATKVPGKAKNAEPVRVKLKPNAKSVRKEQYPMKLEARFGLESLINHFLQYGLLQACQSEFNTPILPVKKPWSHEYRLVQDLGAINQIVLDVHPVVPNPYTLLSAVPENNIYFTVLDLKDAIFCIPLEAESQKLFAFEWESPPTG